MLIINFYLAEKEERKKKSGTSSNFFVLSKLLRNVSKIVSDTINFRQHVFEISYFHFP